MFLALQAILQHGRPLPEGINQFKANLRCHPYFRSADHIELLSSISRLFNTWRTAVKAVPVEEEEEDGQPGLPIHRSEATPLTAVAAGLTPGDTHETRMMTAFVDYLRTVDASFTPRYNGTRPSNKKSNMHKLYLIQNNLDHNCPFREFIPSREHILQQNMIFTSTLIRTEAGFFNALIFLLVLYRAPAILETDGNFNDLAGWNSFCEAHAGENHRWFCNQAAFGSSSNARTKDNVPHFAREAYRWPQWLGQQAASGAEITVLDIWDFLRSMEDGARVFPSCGDLSAFVLAADIASTGLIPLPTGEQIGHVIATINKGAKAAMVRMQLLPENASYLETKTMAARFYDFCTTNLPPDLMIRRNWNGYQFENGLCKSNRISWDFNEMYIDI